MIGPADTRAKPGEESHALIEGRKSPIAAENTSGEAVIQSRIIQFRIMQREIIALNTI